MLDASHAVQSCLSQPAPVAALAAVPPEGVSNAAVLLFLHLQLEKDEKAKRRAQLKASGVVLVLSVLMLPPLPHCCCCRAPCLGVTLCNLNCNPNDNMPFIAGGDAARLL